MQPIGQSCEQKFGTNALHTPFWPTGLFYFSSPISLPLSWRFSSMISIALPLVFLLARVGVHAQTYSATYLPSNAPAQSQQGQTGTNQCGTGSNQTSICQNAYSECSSCLKQRSKRSLKYLFFFLSTSQFHWWFLYLRASEPWTRFCSRQYRGASGLVRHVYKNEYDWLPPFKRIEVAWCMKACRLSPLLHVRCSSALDRMVMERALYPMVPSLVRTL